MLRARPLAGERLPAVCCRRRLTPGCAARHAVVDASGAWLDAWAARLAGCGATHVRAPHTGTPFPSPLALQAFAQRSRRTDELAASSPRFVAVPSVALFADFCADTLPRLPAARVPIRKATVTSLARFPLPKLLSSRISAPPAVTDARIAARRAW